MFDTLCSLCNTISITQVVIFCNTYQKVESLTNNMRLKAFNVSIMHEKMDQIQRQSTLYNFCSGTSPVLITTHLLAQTIDVQVSLVINYDLPLNHEHFIRWIDRSCGFGRKGVVVNFIAKDNKLAMRAIRPFFNTHVIKIKNPTHTSLIQPIADYMNQTSSQPATIPKEPTIHNNDGAQLATNHCNRSCDNQPDQLDEYC
uniref:ATP-dependent RNA helicase fal1 n=1 Tax=Schizaphis graminum TaxID=13262 RepID=A0A2S2PRI0_SCHGA